MILYPVLNFEKELKLIRVATLPKPILAMYLPPPEVSSKTHALSSIAKMLRQFPVSVTSNPLSEVIGILPPVIELTLNAARYMELVLFMHE